MIEDKWLNFLWVNDYFLGKVITLWGLLSLRVGLCTLYQNPTKKLLAGVRPPLPPPVFGNASILTVPILSIRPFNASGSSVCSLWDMRALIFTWVDLYICCSSKPLFYFHSPSVTTMTQSSSYSINSEHNSCSWRSCRNIFHMTKPINFCRTNSFNLFGWIFPSPSLPVSFNY